MVDDEFLLSMELFEPDVEVDAPDDDDEADDEDDDE